MHLIFSHFCESITETRLAGLLKALYTDEYINLDIQIFESYNFKRLDKLSLNFCLTDTHRNLVFELDHKLALYETNFRTA